MADSIEELLLRPPQAFEERKIGLDLVAFGRATATFHLGKSAIGLGSRSPANELETVKFLVDRADGPSASSLFAVVESSPSSAGS